MNAKGSDLLINIIIEHFHSYHLCSSKYSQNISQILTIFMYASSSIVPIHVLSVVQVLMFVLAVLLHGRQVEWTARLDFLWQVQANEEKREMDALQHSNKRILFNLLPAHVATHFLDNQFRNNMVRRLNDYCLTLFFSIEVTKTLILIIHSFFLGIWFRDIWEINKMKNFRQWYRSYQFD